MKITMTQEEFKTFLEKNLNKVVIIDTLRINEIDYPSKYSSDGITISFENIVVRNDHWPQQMPSIIPTLKSYETPSIEPLIEAINNSNIPYNLDEIKDI